jgi:restriction system protein
MDRRRSTSERHVARLWVIRSGEGSKAHDLFLGEGIIALADAAIGDLAKLNGSRDTFYDAYRKSHPEDGNLSVAGIGGKYFRFVHEVRIGDLAVYPALQNKTVYIGVILSEYAFDMKSPFPHQRSVRWKFIIPKSEFSQASQYELGAARTFFEFKRNAGELLFMIANKAVTPFRSNAKSK